MVRANFLFERPAAFWIAPKKKKRDAAGGGVRTYTAVGDLPSSSFTPSFMPSILARKPSASPKSANPT